MLVHPRASGTLIAGHGTVVIRLHPNQVWIVTDKGDEVQIEKPLLTAKMSREAFEKMFRVGDDE